jgi:hypothetical protein
MVRIREGLTSYRSADKQGHLVADASPNDRSVLFMQDQHHSDDIWSGEVR